MIEVTSQQGAVLAFLSVSTLGFICALCVRCRKKSMTKTNQMSTNPCQSSRNFAHTFHSQPDSLQDSGGSYQNIPKPLSGSVEPTYVDPIATPPNKGTVLDDDAGDYANIFPTQDVEHDSDSYDYENTEFLQNSKIDDDDEPDYVNADTTH
ncbi:LAT2 domain-containing protein isoform X4 [Pangasianodon hypophthalmus]|uniref:LAT2 domain-containing protein isoform X4 n=1 Tax=Pangasianodon hypophthalmus TaxID=310915 RepID=UPI0023079424|nr:LAT2 domain-containing protein isoform X4 [Pangasianodon hypophthalmus]